MVLVSNLCAAQGIRYSPYFAFYKGGQKVDEVTGKQPQRLADHIWLHSDE
jgi:thioredoxin 1